MNGESLARDLGEPEELLLAGSELLGGNTGPAVELSDGLERAPGLLGDLEETGRGRVEAFL